MKLIDREIAYSCKRFDVIQEKFDIINGIQDYYHLDTNNAVAGIVRYQKQILFVEQYRSSIGMRELELPGGRIEEGESADDAIVREIKEELGVIRCSIRKLKDYYPIPSLTNQMISYYVVEAYELGAPQREKTERDMKVYVVPETEILVLLESKYIVSAIEAIGLYAYIQQGVRKSTNATNVLFKELK